MVGNTWFGAPSFGLGFKLEFDLDFVVEFVTSSVRMNDVFNDGELSIALVIFAVECSEHLQDAVEVHISHTRAEIDDESHGMVFRRQQLLRDSQIFDEVLFQVLNSVVDEAMSQRFGLDKRFWRALLFITDGTIWSFFSIYLS